MYRAGMRADPVWQLSGAPPFFFAWVRDVSHSDAGLAPRRESTLTEQANL